MRSILRAIRSRSRLRLIFTNAGWLVADKVLRLGGGLVVGVLIARHLGPEEYGLWNYALAFATIFGAFASLGLDSIIVRDIVHDPTRRPELLATGFVLKLVAGFVALAAAAFAISLARPGQPLTLLLVCLSGSGFVFQAAQVADFDLQARGANRVSAMAQGSAFLLMTLIKIVLLAQQAPLMAFAIAGAIEVALGMGLLLGSFVLGGGYLDLHEARWVVAKRLVADSWPLLLGGVAVSLYMRIDQVMLGAFLDNGSVGVYSAAVRLSEAWYFIPMSISTAAFPAIIALKARDPDLYGKRLQQYFDYMFLLGFVAALAITFVGPRIVLALFGENYAAAGPLLVLHIWAGIFVSLGVASSAWLAAEGLQAYSLARTALGCFCNIAINTTLIPTMGAMGAVVGTLIAYGIATYSVLLFTPTRPCGLMLVKALFPIHFVLQRKPYT